MDDCTDMEPDTAIRTTAASIDLGSHRRRRDVGRTQPQQLALRVDRLAMFRRERAAAAMLRSNVPAIISELADVGPIARKRE